MNRDQFSYTTGVLQILRESTTVEKFAIDNIKIVGDSATGDITATYSFGGAGTQTQVKPNQFRKEGGKWAWCQQPPRDSSPSGRRPRRHKPRRSRTRWLRPTA